MDKNKMDKLDSIKSLFNELDEKVKNEYIRNVMYEDDYICFGESNYKIVDKKILILTILFKTPTKNIFYCDIKIEKKYIKEKNRDLLIKKYIEPCMEEAVGRYREILYLSSRFSILTEKHIEILNNN